MNVPDVARMDSPDVLKMPEKGKEEVESLTKISVSDMKSESTQLTYSHRWHLHTSWTTGIQVSDGK